MGHSPGALVGPTASGKESTAVAIARDRSVEILSLDSMKVYRGMDVGTAKAPESVREEVPHHLVDLASPDERFSTRRWLDAAEQALDAIGSRGAFPLFVGGTALYLKSLLYGLFPGPAADPEVRDRLASVPSGELHERLTEVDPQRAGEIHENDRRRLVRALEIHEITGIPPSRLLREWKAAKPPRSLRIVGIRRSREDLYRRIDRRVDRMIAAGLVDEVRGLLDGEPGLGPVARQALGYKEIADHLEGRVHDLAETVRVLKSRTRDFARRQLTWFKHFPVHWIDVAPDEPAVETAGRAARALGLA